MKSWKVVTAICALIFIAIYCGDDKITPLVMQYGEFHGNPVQFVIEGRNAILRIEKHPSRSWLGQESSEELYFLRSEVEKFSQSTATGPIKLGDSEMSLRFMGGFPTWEPYSSVSRERQFICLKFSDDAVRHGRVIQVWGQNSSDKYYRYFTSR